MVLTGAQTLAFFTNEDQMGIPADTVGQMEREGITNVDDLAEFDKDTLQQLADNLRRPAGRVADPNPNAAEGATVPTPPFTFGVRSHKRLLVATNLIRYYQATGRDLTAGNIAWTHVMKNFEIQWKALVAKKDEDAPDVPKISKALPVIKWTEAFSDFLSRVVGVRTIPLSYVIRQNVEVPAATPPLANHQPHSTEHGSVEAELVARASHTHALYRDDNDKVYHYLEEATRSTTYAASIKPYQRRKDGRGAWFAIKNQYAGNDKWEAEIKKQEQLIHTRTWKGQTNFSLEAFTSQHRAAYVSMQQCAEHIQYQLPNEHSRVGFLLDAIQTTDAGLNAAMASVRTDTGDDGTGGMRNDFESTVAHLLPYDPVAKKRHTNNKRGAGYQISEVEAEADVSSTTNTKPSIGKTGVHLRWHKGEEYKLLTKPQRDELWRWREDNPNHPDAKPPGKGKGNKSKGRGTKREYSKKQISSLVNKRVKFELAKKEDKKKEEEGEQAMIMSLIQAIKNNPSLTANTSSVGANEQPAANSTESTLRSILKKAKNMQI